MNPGAASAAAILVKGQICGIRLRGAMDDRQQIRQHMRASDADRQEVIDRLRTALGEGRLKMDEFVERMGQASEAVTYGDLAPLYADLPETGPVARPDPAAPSPRPPRPPPHVPPPSPVDNRRVFAGMPAALNVYC